MANTLEHRSSSDVRYCVNDPQEYSYYTSGSNAAYTGGVARGLVEEMSMRRCFGAIALLLAGSVGGAFAQDENVLRPVADLDARLGTMPFEIVSAEKARGVEQDIALKSEVRFADGVELRIKIRPASAGGASFNNEPRYEAAAYRLQRAFLDEPDYVVPPTALRAQPRAQLKPFVPSIEATFRGADEVVVVAQYWLKKVSGPKEIWDPARFASDPIYAHHVANLNVLTYLIKHGDSNAGNILISTEADNPRVFAVDNGVAFRSEESDRGNTWHALRVPRVPARTIERLRAIDTERLEALLGAVATWEMRDGHLIALAEHARVAGVAGVRRRDGMVQLGLTKGEITDVVKRLQRLLARVDQGEIGSF